MFIQIGLWILGLWKKDGSWTQPYARKIGLIVFIVALVILLAILIPVAKCSYDKSVISEHEKQVQIDDLKAQRSADKVLVEDQKQFEAGQRRLEDAATEAARSDPSGAAKQVGPVTRSYYDNLPEKRR